MEDVKELRGQSTRKIMDIETTKNFEKVVLERVTVSQELRSRRNESKSPRVVRHLQQLLMT